MHTQNQVPRDSRVSIYLIGSLNLKLSQGTILESGLNLSCFCRSGYHGDEIYAKVDDMTYYPVNSMLVSMPTATNTTVGSSSSQFHLPNNLNNMSSSSSSSGAPPAPPPPPPPMSLPPGILGAGGGAYTSSLLPNSKTLSVHHPKPSDYHNFTTVHRSQKIYL